MQFPQTWIDHDKKVKPYLLSHKLVGWGGRLLSWSLFIYCLFEGVFSRLQVWTYAKVGEGFPSWLLFLAAMALGWSVLSLPLDTMGYLIEKQYGLSKQTFSSWLWDKVKGLVVGGVIGGLALGLFYLAVRHGGDSWWLWAATFLVFFSILLAQLAPVLLIPLFMKMKPMADGALKQRLLALCAKFHIEVKEVYHLGMGEKTEKGNAAFMGLGKTKRIVIGDTLYEKFSADEVEAVFAHELGHQVHNDLWKGLALSTVIIYLSFYLADQMLFTTVLPLLRLGEATQLTLLEPVVLLLFFAVLSLVQIPLGLAQVLHSRSRERAADAFAAEKIGCGDKLADALERLTVQNWGQFRPHPVLEWWGHSHPAPFRRILKLRQK